MPPARRNRTSGGPVARGSQSVLSFGNTKITKPAQAKSTKSKLQSKESTPVPSASPSTTDIHIPKEEEDIGKQQDVGHVTSEAAVLDQAKAEIRELKSKKNEKSEIEKKAESMSAAQIRKYWQGIESMRIAKRVHQEDLSTEEKILRYFDVSSQYGPSIGIARMKRWMRANKLGLNPPIEVLAVLLKEEAKGNDKIERAYIDELMSSGITAGEP
ncbi:DNA polymerase delta [Xylogone sp. PMI_703]|nr:DNA polymerase delta [Xylogone sp. PMI_703]